MAESPEQDLPKYPILSIEEVDSRLDLRQEVPEIAPLLGDAERVVDVSRVTFDKAKRHPSALRAMLDICGVEHSVNIGENGPPVASRSTKEHSKTASLNKYEDLFGRDSLRVAFFLRDFYPELLKTTVRELAKKQGLVREHPVDDEPFAQEEPGKIPHHVKDPEDPVARKFSKQQGWGWPFYGSIDATPLYINAVTTYAKRDASFLLDEYVAKDGTRKTIDESLTKAVDWLGRQLDTQPDGLLQYRNPDTRKSGNGMRNQAWRDSADAYTDEEGAMARVENGIIALEVQGLAYDALHTTAETYEQAGRYEEARSCRNRADILQRSVMDKLWVEDEAGGFFVLGADYDEDGVLRPLKVRSSSMGHLLNTGLLEGDDPKIVYRRERVIKDLFSPHMLTPQGIRTISDQSPAYREGGYHTGSVWPWDTYEVSLGLERHGYYGLAWELKQRIWSVVDDTHRFPEFVRGNNDEKTRLNSLEAFIADDKQGIVYALEQPPQEIQAWTVASMLAAKKKHPRLFSLNPERSLRQKATATPTRAHDAGKQQFERDILRGVKNT